MQMQFPVCFCRPL